MCLPYPHNLMNLKQSVYVIISKSLAFPIRHCGEDPPLPVEATHISVPQESLVHRASLRGHTGYTSHGKEGQSLELRTAKVFLLVARLGEL